VAAAAPAFRGPAPSCGRSPGPRPRSDSPAAIRCGGAAYIRAFSELSAFASLHVSPVGASLDQLSFRRATLCHDKPPRARPCNRDAGARGICRTKITPFLCQPLPVSIHRRRVRGGAGTARIADRCTRGGRARTCCLSTTRSSVHERGTHRVPVGSHQGRSAFCESVWGHSSLRLSNHCQLRPSARPSVSMGRPITTTRVDRRAGDPAASCRDSNAGPAVKVPDKSLQGLNRRSCVLSICHGCCFHHVTPQVCIGRALETVVGAT
jgi:hypothetical protein